MGSQLTHEPIRISIEDAKQRYDQGNITVLDVVDAEAYHQLSYRIQDAVRIKPEDVPDEFKSLPQDRSVLTYWTWPHEETSASVALFLRKQGYQAYAIQGGLEAWREAGYPVEEKEG
jgi:rhodanese-related sulfurtransferase